jgi:phosphoribosylcarboxyaminoimidazole (NCAIR) mutase
MGAKNAGHLAAEILALSDARLRGRLVAARLKQSADILARAAGLPGRLRELLKKG